MAVCRGSGAEPVFLIRRAGEGLGRDPQESAAIDAAIRRFGGHALALALMPRFDELDEADEGDWRSVIPPDERQRWDELPLAECIRKVDAALRAFNERSFGA